MNLRYLFICFLCMSCYQVERDCAAFKTGTFEFNYVVDGEERTGRFVRTETLNIDYFEGKIDSASIRWINDCEYIQKTINPKSMSEEQAIHMKIISTTDSTYTFEYMLAVKKDNERRRVEKGVAKKIN